MYFNTFHLGYINAAASSSFVSSEYKPVKVKNVTKGKYDRRRMKIAPPVPYILTGKFIPLPPKSFIQLIVEI